MMNRIAVPFLAVSLLATSALAAEPSPKPSPAASPAKVVVSPKPTATPAKAAAVTKPHEVARTQKHRVHRVAASTATSGSPTAASAKSTVAK